jgi:DNA-binding winged helix-turn-helix (wHTH) protein
MQTIMIVEDDPDIRDGVRIALDCNRVWVDEQEADLTETEYKILKLLMQSPQRICTVWGKGYRFAAQDISVRFVKENGKAGLAFENAVLPGQHRTDSTKVGLTSIETMMEKMHAACRIEQSGERFCITLLFPIALSVTPQA